MLETITDIWWPVSKRESPFNKNNVDDRVPDKKRLSKDITMTVLTLGHWSVPEGLGRSVMNLMFLDI